MNVRNSNETYVKFLSRNNVLLNVYFDQKNPRGRQEALWNLLPLKSTIYKVSLYTSFKFPKPKDSFMLQGICTLFWEISFPNVIVYLQININYKYLEETFSFYLTLNLFRKTFRSLYYFQSP